MREGFIRYNVQEHRSRFDGLVQYTVQTGRNGRTKAFRLRIEGPDWMTGDSWPLRREIARHAGVDPDDIFPYWENPERIATPWRTVPYAWYARTDPSAEPPCTVKETIEQPHEYRRL